MDSASRIFAVLAIAGVIKRNFKSCDECLVTSTTLLGQVSAGPVVEVIERICFEATRKVEYTPGNFSHKLFVAPVADVMTNPLTTTSWLSPSFSNCRTCTLVQSRSDVRQQTADSFCGDKSQGSGSEVDLGDNVKGLEFETDAETSDEETGRDRPMINDARPALSISNPPVQNAQVSAAMETADSDTDSLSIRHIKRRAPEGSADALPRICRARVIRSPSCESSAPEPRARSPSMDASSVQPDGDLDEPMPDAAADNEPWWGLSSGPPPALDNDWDDCWSDVDDPVIEDEFSSKCVMVPRPRWSGGRVSPPPSLCLRTWERQLD